MDFYSTFLLLLLLRETSSLYIREASPKDQAQCTETTETHIWQAADPMIKNDVALEVSVTRSCRPHTLLKRQGKPPRDGMPNNKGKNIFNAICQRERTGRPMTRTHVMDLNLPINGNGFTRVPTPDGGSIFIWVDQMQQYFNRPFDWQEREEMGIMITNESECEVSIEWLTRLYLYPNHPGQTSETLAPRTLEPTARDNWETDPTICELGQIMPVHDAVVVALRLLIKAFGGTIG